MTKDTGSDRIVFVYDDLFCRVDITRDELRDCFCEDSKIKKLLDKETINKKTASELSDYLKRILGRCMRSLSRPLKMTNTLTIELPDIGDVDSVDVVEIIVSVGQRVEVESPLITLESDKATMDLPSTTAGTVTTILVQVGDTISKGSPVLILKTDATDSVTPGKDNDDKLSVYKSNIWLKEDKPRTFEDKRASDILTCFGYGASFNAIADLQAVYRRQTRGISVYEVEQVLKMPDIAHRQLKLAHSNPLKPFEYPVGKPQLQAVRIQNRVLKALESRKNTATESAPEEPVLGLPPDPNNPKYQVEPAALVPKPDEPKRDDKKYRLFLWRRDKTSYLFDHARWREKLEDWRVEQERKQHASEAPKREYEKDVRDWKKTESEYKKSLKSWKSLTTRLIDEERQREREYDLTIRCLHNYHDDLVNKNREAFEVSLGQWKKDARQWKEDQHLEKFAELQRGYESGTKVGVEQYFLEVLDRSLYPKPFPKKHKLSYDTDTQLLLIEKQLPNLDLGMIYRKKPKKGQQVLESVSKTEHQKFSDHLIYAVAIRSAYEVCRYNYKNIIKEIALNGALVFVDPKDGNTKERVVVSFKTEVDHIKKIKLARVDPKLAIKNIGGIASPSLKNFVPVNPIMSIDRTDHRIVEGRDVLKGLDETQNLASLDWQDFEHLVREVIEKEFTGEGTEVHVTQASRDQGVDAIAFDSDPIRGGKFVFQAKRYTNVVSVSAARDLYGTVINEGAVKGILITTSDFGPDTFEFVKDKPITLISGGQLLGLLERHGYKFRINLEEAKVENRQEEE